MSTPRPSYSFDGLHRHLAAGRNKTQRPTDVPCLRVYLDTRTNEPEVCMHSTTIATFHENGTITVRAGGWEDSSTTRARIGEVTGLRIGTIAQHKKRAVVSTTRAYAGYAFPYGVPFEDGIIVKSGTVIWHPAMKRQGVTDIKEITEEIERVNPVMAKPYRDDRRAFLKRVRHLLGFVSEENLTDHWPRDLTAWFEELITTQWPDDELYSTLCHLLALGKDQNSNFWKQNAFDPAANLKRALAKCSGAGSWDILRRYDAIEAVRVLSTEV